MSSQRQWNPKIALSLFYSAQFAHLGIVMPFLAPWFKSRGFSAEAIGALVALPALFKILSPWLWGHWADISGRRRELLVLACVAAGAGLAGLIVAPYPWMLVLLVALYGFARSPLLPYAEATALEQSSARGFAYGPVRLWGSIAFVVGSAVYGWIADAYSASVGMLVGALCLGGAALAALAFPAPLGELAEEKEKAKELFPGTPDRGRRGLVAFFVACALMQMSHGGYYAFYSIRLQDLGYDAKAIAGMWALGVVCEILLLFKLDAWVHRLGSLPVLRFSLLAAALRWILISGVESTGWLLFAQTLHAFTYAAFHVAAIRVVFQAYGSRRARGQAMYSGMTYGVGMFVGSLVAGWIAGGYGLGPLFLTSAGMAILGFAVLAAVPRHRRRA